MLIGGAICVSDGKLSVDDSSFVNNSADYGGAIYVNYGDLTISNSTLFNNTVSSDGNAIYNYEGTATANDNWWGNNAPPWEELVHGDDCEVTHDTYAVLSLTATNNNVAINFYRNGATNVLPIFSDVNLTIDNQPKYFR